MSSFFEICKWLQHTTVGTAVSESLWLFPLIETIHIWGIILLVGTTGVLDLRMLGIVLTKERVSDLHRQLIVWTWTGFSVMFITGSLMFASEAAKMYINEAFQIKMLFILVAGINALVFEFTAFRHVANWDTARVAPLAGKIAACVSLVVWVGVIAAGRWIAYV
jgi:hypothetical protein